MPLLHVEKMSHDFGGLRAVRDYYLEIEPGQVRGLIGPNGAGKTTIFNLITGIYRPTEGTIRFDGNEIIGLKPYEIAAMGLGRTFQNMRLWRHMTVLEHVKLARYSKLRYGLFGAFFGTPKRHEEEARIGENSSFTPGNGGRPPPCRPGGDQSSLRRAAASGTCQGTCHGAEVTPAGRAHRRNEP